MSTASSMLESQGSDDGVAVGGREHVRRRREIALAWGVAVFGLAGCGVVLASGVGELWCWQVPVFVVCLVASDAGAVNVGGSETGSWFNNWTLFGALAMAFLGPAATFAVFGISELCLWLFPARRPRPFTRMVNIVGAAGTFMLGSIVMMYAREAFGVRAAGFYIVLGLVALVCDILTAAWQEALRWLRWHERALADVPLRQVWGAACVNVPLAVAAARVYEGNNYLGLALTIAMGGAFTVMLRLIGDALRRADENAVLAAGRAALLAQVLEAEDRERRHLAEELHDDAVQNLLAVGHELEDMAAGKMDRLSRAQTLLARTLEQLRAKMSEMHPSVLEHAGLEAALTTVLETQAARRGFEWKVEVAPGGVGGHDRLVFSLARELIANAAWHASASAVSVRVAADRGDLVLEVSDDGVGFDPGQVRMTARDGHLGLASVQQRAGAAGGSARIDSVPGSGTRATVVLPLPPGTG